MTKTEDIIRIGQVSSIYPEQGTCRVAFGDMQDDGTPLVSAPLRILYHRTVDRQDFTMPAVGEHVLCVFMPNGYEEGFVIGSFYTSASNLPSRGYDGIYSTAYSDGTEVRYDMNEKALTVHSAGDLTITAAGDININATGNVRVAGARIDLN